MEHLRKRPRLADADDGATLNSGNGALTEREPTPSTDLVDSVATAFAGHELASRPMTTATVTAIASSTPPQISDIIRTPDKSTWQGWAEIENDPTVFDIMLREWGVRGVRINEVVPLDAVFDSSPALTLGLIFLSRYRSSKKERTSGKEQERMEMKIPRDLWFANQISTYSCATVALMNIIGNAVGKIDLGPEISRFVALTRDKSSKERGLALDSFEYVRRVHNSFATLIDMKCVDQRLREDAKAYNIKRKKQEKQQQIAPGKAKMSSSKSKRTKGGKPKMQPYSASEDDNDEDEGFHFTAYVPSHNHLWRMDGLERVPKSLGGLSASCTAESNSNNDTKDNANINELKRNDNTDGDITDKSSSWLSIAAAELSTQMEEAMTVGNEIEFSVLSLVAARDKDGVRDDDANENSREIEASRMMEDWGPALAEVVRIVAGRGGGSSGINSTTW